MKNETTLNFPIPAENGALLCVNALKAFTEGNPEAAEGFMPGFAEVFFSQEPADRQAIMNLLLAELEG
jgi:hypothetical protein